MPIGFVTAERISHAGTTHRVRRRCRRLDPDHRQSFRLRPSAASTCVELRAFVLNITTLIIIIIIITIGDRTFPAAAASVWNSLPESVRASPSGQTERESTLGSYIVTSKLQQWWQQASTMLSKFCYKPSMFLHQSSCRSRLVQDVQCCRWTECRHRLDVHRSPAAQNITTPCHYCNMTASHSQASLNLLQLHWSGADPPALLIRVPFLKRTVTFWLDSSQVDLTPPSSQLTSV